MQTERIKRGAVPIRNFDAYVGDTFEFALSIEESGDPVDCSLDSWKMRIEDSATGAEFLTLENNDGIAFPEVGKVLITVSAVQAGLFLAGKKYKYDLQRTRQSIYVRTLLRGLINATKDVTPP